MAVDDKSPLPGSGHRVSKVEPHAERETLPCDRDEHPPVHEAAPQSRQQSHHQNDAAVRYGEDVNDGPCTAVEWNRASNARIALPRKEEKEEENASLQPLHAWSSSRADRSAQLTWLLQTWWAIYVLCDPRGMRSARACDCLSRHTAVLTKGIDRVAGRLFGQAGQSINNPGQAAFRSGSKKRLTSDLACLERAALSTGKKDARSAHQPLLLLFFGAMSRATMPANCLPKREKGVGFL
ncbi:hypothetical protein HPB51_009064 [Rhipicephalus microplus]|uniref:Uncharacterized protein n=1 Tax=Rhipicephalus microplus TaxID=6941 RepID=A0A9J6D9K6_RHIMP|nr:hypothetical protein HPB51_009064 [Rhipicephalus microplus]